MRAVHREIGRVDLQDQALLVDRLIFVPHLARERVEISLVTVVMRIDHGREMMPGEGAVMNISAKVLSSAAMRLKRAISFLQRLDVVIA